MPITGPLRKMATALPVPSEPVQYELKVGDAQLPLNSLVGQPIALTFLDKITCIECGRITNKSFAQGHCFPCMKKLPQTDTCMVRPETCHLAAGTCRDEAWGREHCDRPHTVYLANSSGLKVGITRGLDPIPRWIDQGAYEGLAVRTVENRLDSGRLEVILKEHVNDKTNWRAMLRGNPEPVDLRAARERLINDDLPGIPVARAEVVTLTYPVNQYPDKVRSHNFTKIAKLEGTLHGIKGQYLMVGDHVINVRSNAGYHVQFDH